MTDPFRDQLAARVAGEVRTGIPGEDDHDASHYRLVPRLVLEAGSVDDLCEAVRFCRQEGLHITMRGGGSSLAGQSVGDGLLIDTRRLDHVSVDPEDRTAVVGPGCTLDRLNSAAAEHGLWFGPDVSSSGWATIGGMIGNDSCGSRSSRYGRTSAHIERLDLVSADGSRSSWNRGTIPESSRRIHQKLHENAGLIDEVFTPLPRRVAGYGIDRWLRDPSDPGVLAGSEGTLALVAEATLRLTPRPRAVSMVVVSAASVPEALEQAAGLADQAPDSAELLDASLLSAALEDPRYADVAESLLGDAGAVVLVDFLGDDSAGRAMAAASLSARSRLLSGDERAELVALRRAGLGLLMSSRPGLHAASIIEDLAVPPERTAEFAADLVELISGAGWEAAVYGHADAGCLHVRPWVDMDRDHQNLWDLQSDAVALALGYGGTSTGEHGDGRLRSHLLETVYPKAVIEMFSSIKHAFDPDNVFNPGIIVDPVPPTFGFDHGRAGADRARAVAAGPRT
ncbi:MAG: FAD-binding oxidoreductase [Actinomycetota bacterium]